jgi:hypothetical protein
VTEQEIIAFVEGLDGVEVQTAAEGDGSPESAWGDSFFTVEGQQMPFATVVVSNYPGFDEASDLDRHGVFRLNVGVGRERFTELVGHPPSAPAEGVDYTGFDTVLPHPQYATQSWVAIVCPGERTDALARELLEFAHRRAR